MSHDVKVNSIPTVRKKEQVGLKVQRTLRRENPLTTSRIKGAKKGESRTKGANKGRILQQDQGLKVQTKGESFDKIKDQSCKEGRIKDQRCKQRENPLTTSPLEEHTTQKNNKCGHRKSEAL